LWDLRALVVEMSEKSHWLNASFQGVSISVFLQHRYLLDVAGSACAT
jgi:hypothetical protein